MKTLQLLQRTDTDTTWYIIRLTVDGKVNDKHFATYIRGKKAFDIAVNNFEILGKETVIRTASFNDEVRTVYVSADNGAAFLELKDFGSWYDIKTDASLDVVEHAMASNKGDIDKAIQEINEIGLFAERVKTK